MARVGTRHWAAETHGELRLRDRVDLLVGQGVPTWIGLKVDDALLRTGFRNSIDLSEIDIVDEVRSQIPDTSIAHAATGLCSRISEPWLFAHCQRTFAFGVLLGDGFDRETLCLAAMLHDVGLTEAYEHGADPGLVPDYAGASAPCFAVRSSEVARSLADEFAWREAPDRDALAEAIALHVNVRVKGSQGVEARLVHLASALDVTGLRSRRLGGEAIGIVEDEWPRDESFPRRHLDGVGLRGSCPPDLARAVIERMGKVPAQDLPDASVPAQSLHVTVRSYLRLPPLSTRLGKELHVSGPLPARSASVRRDEAYGR
jgi:hypothetical protein